MKLQDEARTRTWWRIELEFVNNGTSIFVRPSIIVLVEADTLKEAEKKCDEELHFPKLDVDISYEVRIIEARRITWGIEYVFPKDEK